MIVLFNACSFTGTFKLFNFLTEAIKRVVVVVVVPNVFHFQMFEATGLFNTFYAAALFLGFYSDTHHQLLDLAVYKQVGSEYLYCGSVFHFILFHFQDIPIFEL